MCCYYERISSLMFTLFSLCAILLVSVVSCVCCSSSEVVSGEGEWAEPVCPQTPVLLSRGHQGVSLWGHKVRNYTLQHNIEVFNTFLCHVNTLLIVVCLG